MWSWVADELRRRGHRVTVPALTDAAGTGGWEACVAAVLDAVRTDEPVALVGHSGAGPLLPAIAERLPTPPALLVFVDANLPPVAGDAPLVPDAFAQALQDLAKDGILPRWSEWFSPGAVEALLPDPQRRAAVLAEQPRVPLAFFDGRVPMPADWFRSSCAYIILSDPYRPDAAEAASRGWPVVELVASHLEPAVHPANVADALLDVSSSDAR
jgi:hypothetical protein